MPDAALTQSPPKYRREIDGLRALAVIPVIFFHGGFSLFRGGFVGVDVFFVISGYLITAIIIADLQQGTFSLARFYERRARRILPALFVVMAAQIPFAYFWMMPDEFKNFGQSLLATAAFSNNILLAATSDYWALASEFKPLLHSWSLAVEEQYYLLFPLLMIGCWRRFADRTRYGLAVLFCISLMSAAWGVTKFPAATFYLLPTRAWEILLGALVAHHLAGNNPGQPTKRQSQMLSLLGGALIALAVFYFDRSDPAPGLTTLVPAVGTVLIILFAVEGTLVHRVLASQALVGIGLVSYSLYLWHQPLFAFARIYAEAEPSAAVILALILVALALAYLTWRFVERPFRNRAILSRKTVVLLAVLGSFGFILLGGYLNATYGMAWRAFDPQIRLQDMDKRAYNERVFGYQKEAFSSSGKIKLLVVGNSHARDFVNIILETFDTRQIDIVYRSDLPDCIFPYRDAVAEALYGKADIIVFAHATYRSCVRSDLQFAAAHKKELLFVGTTSFGYNLNYLIRLPREQQRNRYNRLSEGTIALDRAMAESIPAGHYISLLAPVTQNGEVPITDEEGRLLSTDRVHLTKYGAIFFGQRVLRQSPYGKLLPPR